MKGLFWLVVFGSVLAVAGIVWYTLRKFKERQRAEEERAASFLAATAGKTRPVEAQPTPSPAAVAPAANTPAGDGLAQQKMLFEAAHKAGEAGEPGAGDQLYARLLAPVPGVGVRRAGAGGGGSAEKEAPHRLKLRVQPAGFEDARRIESALQIAMQAREHRRQRRERALGFIRGRGTASHDRPRPRPPRARSQHRNQSAAHRSAPPHSTNCSPGRPITGACEGSDRRHMRRAPPQRTARDCSRMPSQKRAASSIATVSPPSFSAAERTALAAPDRRSESSPSRQALADTRQRLARPAVEGLQRLRLRSSNFSVRSSGGRGSSLSDTSTITPSVPSEPASRRETS